LLASTFGSQFTIVATYVQVFRLTGSVVAVGVIGLVGFCSLVMGPLAGTMFLDAFDRRKILIGAKLGYAVSSGTLFLGALAGRPPIGLIYAAVAGIARTRGIEGAS